MPRLTPASLTKVLFHGQLQPLHKVLESQRRSMPTLKVAYHEMKEEPQPGKPGNFSIKRINSIWYTPQSGNNIETEGGQEESGPSSGQQTAAKLVPNATWNGHSTRIVFSVKASPTNGLTPIRPQVVLVKEIELNPNTCAELF